VTPNPNNIERAHASSVVGAALSRSATVSEVARATGIYHAVCHTPRPHLLREYIEIRDAASALDRLVDTQPLRSVLLRRQQRLATLRRDLAAIPLERKWTDRILNIVTTEGKNAALTHFLKGSSYTASLVLGLIEDTGYSAVAAGNTAANITAVGSGSPANGWNEAPVGTCAARGTPSFGTASAGSLATSSAVSFSILATDTIKGLFLLCRSAAGTAPTTTVGNTNGALYSAGLSSGGDKGVANGDTVTANYTASL
jgi:hypothetical protein